VSLPSPNFGPRRNGLRPRLVVLHYTAMGSVDAAYARLCDPKAEVSAHHLISQTGQVTQLVAEDMRAWHAGAGAWQGKDDINSRSIGIELDNTGTSPFTAPLMDALERLLAEIMQRWSIPASGVIGHSDMAPGRKCDPGPRFDWLRLERQGLARARGQQGLSHPVSWATFRAAAQSCGYSADLPDEVLLQAVRLRYRNGARGALSAEDLVPLGL